MSTYPGLLFLISPIFTSLVAYSLVVFPLSSPTDFARSPVLGGMAAVAIASRIAACPAVRSANPTNGRFSGSP